MSRVATAPTKEERVHETQRHLKIWMRNKINRNMTRNPFQRLEIEARNIRTISQDARFIKKGPEPVDKFKQHLILSHRASANGNSILNLPKQPFGRHQTYNDTEDFMQNHVVLRAEILSPQKAKQVDEVVRQFRLSKKRDNYKQFRVQTQDSARDSQGNSISVKRKEYDEFVTATGRLWCPKEKWVEEAYDEQKKKYQSIDLSRSTDLEAKLLQQLKLVHNPVGKSPFNRLYLESFKERRTSPMSERLSSKYSQLFQDDSGTRQRRRHHVGSLDVKFAL